MTPLAHSAALRAGLSLTITSVLSNMTQNGAGRACTKLTLLFPVSLHVALYVVDACVCRCTPLCVHMEVRGRCWVSSSIVHHLFQTGLLTEHEPSI